MKVMKRSRKSEETLTSCMDEMRQHKTTKTNNYAHIHVLPKCVTSLFGFMCFVLMFLWILVFTLSLVSDVSPFSTKVLYVNFISPRLRNSKYKVLSSGCCSPTLSCQRQLNLYPKFLHISHREKGSFEVLSLHVTRVFSLRNIAQVPSTRAFHTALQNYSARLREEHTSDSGSSADDGSPPKGGWQRRSCPARVGVGHTERDFCDGQSLASSRRWPMAERRDPTDHGWQTVSNYFLNFTELCGSQVVRFLDCVQHHFLEDQSSTRPCVCPEECAALRRPVM